LEISKPEATPDSKKKDLKNFRCVKFIKNIEFILSKNSGLVHMKKGFSSRVIFILTPEDL